MSCNNYNTESGTPIQFAGSLPDGFCHTTWPATFSAFLAAFTGSLPGSYSTFIIQSETPSAANRDKIWAKVSDACIPLGLFVFYDGSWKRFIPHHLPPGCIIDYWDSTLDETDHAANARKITYLDVYDETYSALTDATSPFWRVCDGTNGTPDLRGRFRLGAGDNPDATITDRLPATYVGSETVILTAEQLPTLNVPLGTGSSAGLTAAARATSPAASLALNAGGNGHPNIPPAACMYAIMRTSRTI